MTKRLWLILMVLLVITAGCSGRAQAGAAGDPEAGKALFNQTTIRDAPACSTCHSTEPGEVIVGPSLAGIASRASERKAGLPADQYLRESIVDPNAYLVEGFAEGVMYQNFKEVLTEDEIHHLIAYLLTMK